MRKFVVSIGLMLTLALGVVAGPVHPAAAQGEEANCVAELFGTAAQTAGPIFGKTIKRFATESGGIGQFVGPSASTDCGIPL